MSRIPLIEAGIRDLCTDPMPFLPKAWWIDDDLMKLYARAGRRVVVTQSNEAVWNYVLTLATFEVIDPADYRKGLMRELFDFAEGFVAGRPDIGCTYVECANEEILIPFLQGRGYRIRPGTDPFGNGTGADWFKMINPDAPPPRR